MGERESTIEFSGSQTISGAGELVFRNERVTHSAGMVRLSPGTTLTLGPDITVRAESAGGYLDYDMSGAGIVNLGRITSQYDRPPLDVRSPTFDNRGVVEATHNGHVIIRNQWTNSGVLRLRDAGIIDLGGQFTWGDIGSIDRAGGTLRIVGTLDNRNRTATANAVTGDVHLAPVYDPYWRAEIVGGRIAAEDGHRWVIAVDEEGVMDGVQLAAPLEITSGKLVVRNGMTIDDQTITISSTEGLPLGQIVFSGDQTLAGIGRIDFTGGRANRLVVERGTQLTIGPGILIQSSTGEGGISGSGSVVNEGVVLVDQRQFDIEGGRFSNRGVIRINRDGYLRLGATEWNNGGTLEIMTGGAITLAGSYSSDDLGTIIDRGARLVYIAGEIRNENRELDISRLGFSSPVTFNGGTIRGGRLLNSGNTELRFENYNGFDNVTIAGDLQIGSTVSVIDDLILEDNSTLFVTEGTSLLFPSGQPQLLGGAGTIRVVNIPQFGGITTIGGRSLKIGEDILIRNGREGLGEVRVVFKENYGTILSEAPRTDFFIGDGDNWTNRGLIRSTDGTLWLTGNLITSGLGTIEARGGEVIVAGNVDNAGERIVVNQATGPWSFQGVILGGHLEARDGLSIEVDDGILDDVTLVGSTVLRRARARDSLRLDGATIAMTDDAELAIDGKFEFRGAGEIVFDSTSGRNRIETFTGSHVTIREGVTIRTGQGSGVISRSELPVVNEGAIVAETARQSIELSGSLVNRGLLAARNRSQLDILAPRWTNEGQMQIDAGVITVIGESFQNAPGGSISGTGALNVLRSEFTNAGVLSPGTSKAGYLDIVGDLTQLPTGVVSVELTGRNVNEYDFLRVTQTAMLDGALEVKLADGFVPSADDVFKIIATRAIEGQFGATSVNLEGSSFDVLYEDNSVTLKNFRVDGPSLQAGDADMNLKFDQLDVIKVLLAGKYLTGQPATWGEGDWDRAPGGIPGHPPTGDKLFNHLDIVAALQNGLYLAGPYAAGGLAQLAPNLTDMPTEIIPEPASGTLVMIALILLAAGYWRRRRMPNCRLNPAIAVEPANSSIQLAGSGIADTAGRCPCR